MDKTWVRIAPSVVAEAEYDRIAYEMGDAEIGAKLTGRLRMTREAVLDGMWGDMSLSDECADRHNEK